MTSLYELVIKYCDGTEIRTIGNRKSDITIWSIIKKNPSIVKKISQYVYDNGMPNYSYPLLIIRDKPNAFIDKFWEEQMNFHEKDLSYIRQLKNTDEVDEDLSKELDKQMHNFHTKSPLYNFININQHFYYRMKPYWESSIWDQKLVRKDNYIVSRSVFQFRLKKLVPSNILDIVLHIRNQGRAYIAGGLLVGCATPIVLKRKNQIGTIPCDDVLFNHEYYQNSDIDLFIVSKSDEDFKNHRNWIIDELQKTEEYLDAPIIVTKKSTTIVGRYPNRHIQIIHKRYRHKYEIINNFDIDVCCLCYDSLDLYGNYRSIRSLRTLTNMVDPSRIGKSYLYRLIKYSKRGFTIIIPGMTKIQNNILSYVPSWFKNILNLPTNMKISYRESYNMFSSNMRSRLTSEEIDHLKENLDNNNIISSYNEIYPYGFTNGMVCGDVYNIYYDIEYKLLNNTTHLGNWSKIKDIDINLNNFLNNNNEGTNSLVEYWYKYSCIKSKHPLCEKYDSLMIKLNSNEIIDDKLEKLYENDIEWFKILNNKLLFSLKNTFIFITRINDIYKYEMSWNILISEIFGNIIEKNKENDEIKAECDVMLNYQYKQSINTLNHLELKMKDYKEDIIMLKMKLNECEDRYKIEEDIINTNITVDILKLQIKYYDFKSHNNIYHDVRKQWYESLVVIISNQVNYITKSLKTLDSYITILNKFILVLDKRIHISNNVSLFKLEDLFNIETKIETLKDIQNNYPYLLNNEIFFNIFGLKKEEWKYLSRNYELIMSVGYYDLHKKVDEYNNSSKYIFNTWNEYKNLQKLISYHKTNILNNRIPKIKNKYIYDLELWIITFDIEYYSKLKDYDRWKNKDIEIYEFITLELKHIFEECDNNSLELNDISIDDFLIVWNREEDTSDDINKSFGPKLMFSPKSILKWKIGNSNTTRYTIAKVLLDEWRKDNYNDIIPYYELQWNIWTDLNENKRNTPCVFYPIIPKTKIMKRIDTFRKEHTIHTSTIEWIVDRDNIIDMFHNKIITLSSFELCSKQKFCLSEDELGVDYGGVSREIRQLYVDEIKKSFDKTENGYLLPSSNGNIGFWESVGGVFALYIIQGWKLPLKLAPFVFNYIVSYIDNDIPSNKELWLHYNQINPNTAIKMLNYSDVSSDGIINNKDDVHTIIRDYLINNRLVSLQALCNGFWKGLPSEPELSWNFAISIMTADQLSEILLCYEITSINQINFKSDNSPKSEEIIDMIKEVLSNWTQKEVSDFIMFVTGDRIYNDDDIVVSSFVNSTNHLPSASTCSKILRIPTYETKEILNNKLRDAIEMSKNRFDLI